MSSQQSRPRSLGRPIAIAVALGLGLAGPLVVATPAFAATIIVTVETDVLPVPDVGSLRWAVGMAASGDTITFDTSTVDRIDLVSALTVPKGITIDGPDPELLTIGRASTGWWHQFFLAPDVADQDYTIRDLTVEGRADGTGVAIAASTAGGSVPRDLTLSNVVVKDQINNFGPAVNTFHLIGDLVIDDSRFQNNSATGYGGAMVLSWIEGDITITNSLLLNNTAGTTGGAIDIEFNRGAGSEILISDTVFENNSAGSGGGLSVRGARDVELSGVTFDSNSALTHGGGASIGWDSVNAVDELRIEDSLFDNNVSGDEGGGLAVDHLDGPFELTGSVFDGNESNSGDGGGVSIDQINEGSLIFGSTFHENDVNAGYGGGVYAGGIIAAVFGITDTSFFDNRSQFGGAGLAVGGLVGASDDGLRIANSTFAGNSIFSGIAGGSSIAVQYVGAPFLMAQITVDDPENSASNHAVYAETVDYDGGGPPALGIGSSTIAGSGGVLVATHTEGPVIVTHSILESLSLTRLALTVQNPSQGFEIDLDWSLLSTGMQSYYNSIAGNTFDVADMELGTLADNGGPTWTRLPLNGSPAINTGDPTVTAPGDFDQREDGFARVVGGRIDIGAVELQTLALAATGATVNWFLLGGGGALLLLGAGLVLWVRLRRSAVHRA